MRCPRCYDKMVCKGMVVNGEKDKVVVQTRDYYCKRCNIECIEEAGVV